MLTRATSSMRAAIPLRKEHRWIEFCSDARAQWPRGFRGAWLMIRRSGDDKLAWSGFARRLARPRTILPALASRGRQSRTAVAYILCWDCWKQTTSYCATLLGFLEFCGWDPA